MRQNNHHRDWGILAVLVIAIGASLAFGQLDSSPALPTRRPSVDPAVVRHAEALSEAFRQASEVVLPTVVKVKSKVQARRVVRSEGFGLEDLFGGGELMIPPSSGTGSGVIIDRKGIILTNNHVVAGADTVTIEMEDGREFIATSVHTDPQSDLAVVRINSDRDLPFAKLGDSSSLRIGDWVLAIGNPFEFESSVSAGIISAKGRSLDAAQRTTFLQTDAAINPGNSGGPLVNLKGEVIGINTAIASKTGAFNGIGFAIPVNMVKWVSQQLVDGGKVNRAWLGVGIRPVTRQVRRAFDLQEAVQGVLVGEVRYGAPSDEGGMKPGDIITTVSGRSVTSSPELQQIVEQSPLGSNIEMQVIREGRPMRLKVRTEALPEDQRQVVRRPRLPKDGQLLQVSDLGVYLFALSSEQSKQLHLKFAESGLLIAGASEQAEVMGLTEGAVIYRIGDQTIQSQADLERALEREVDGNLWKLYLELPQASNKLVLFPAR